MDERNPKPIYWLLGIMMAAAVIGLFLAGFGAFPGYVGGAVAFASGLILLLAMFWIAIIIARTRAARRGDPADPEAPFTKN